MEIDITRFFESADPFEFSASRAERGQNAGPETWANAKQEGADAPLLTTPEQMQALRDHVKEFGAWDAEEIAAWDDIECNALFIQMVSSAMREADLDSGEPDWEAYEAMLGGKDNPIMGEALPPLALGQVWRTLGRWIDLRNESSAPQTGQEKGIYSGSIYRGSDERIYYYLGS